MRWFARQAKEWGALGVSLFALVIIMMIAATYFGAPHGYKVIDPPPQAVSSYVKNDLSPGVDELGNPVVDGPTAGAASDFTYDDPRAWLTLAGIPYEWQPSTHWSSRNYYKPEAIVVHVTAGGTCTGIRDYFRKNDRRVSAHFSICKEGMVWHQVNTGDAAHHAGIWGARQNLQNPTIQRWWTAGLVNPNWTTIGIENVLADGQHIDNYPEQRRALVELLAFLVIEHGILPNRDFIIAHAEIDAVNRPIDPYCCMDLDAIVQEVAALVHGRGAPLPDPVVEWGETDPENGNRWNFLKARWVTPSNYEYDPATGIWTDPQGRPEWGETGAYGERWNIWRGVWVSADGTHEYDFERGWYCVRDCPPPAEPDKEIPITPPACCEGSRPEVSRKKDGSDDGLVLIIGAPTMAALLGAFFYAQRRRR